MKAADLREKSVEDLRELQKALAGDVFQNRLKNFTNRLDDTSALPKTRRDLARIATMLRERELGVLRAAKAAAAAKAEAAPAAAAPAKARKAPARKAAAAASGEAAAEAQAARPKKKSAAKKSEA
jgi:ribosomal protein L29